MKVMPNAVAQPGIDINGNLAYSVRGGIDSGVDIDAAVGRSPGGHIGQTGSHTNDERTVELEDEHRIKSVIDQANEKIKQQNGYRRLAFSYNKETKKISIKVYDEKTKEIIREIPPDKANVLLDKINDLVGMVVDEKR